MNVIVVLTAMPDSKSAQKLADGLVRKKLAACVSVLPGMASTYHWKGKVRKARESLVLIKTSKTKWDALQKFVLSQHPYELPELVVLPLITGSKKYLSWVSQSIQ